MTSKTHWFISDLHLAPEETRITAGFLHFLQQPQNGDALYILGDFFNYWVGDDIQDPFSDTIKKALKETALKGINLFFMPGNRDFLLGTQFCQDCHIQLLEDPSLIQIEDESVLLMHGDSLCTKDTAYMEFRAMVRTPAWQTQFLNQSIDDRQAYAQKAREESKKGNAMKDDNIMDVTLTEVDKVLLQKNVRRLIHGHTHRPAIHNWQLNGKEAQRVVLGDWFKKGWFLKADKQGYNLVEFDLPEID